MLVASWNVNSIRAREQALRAWLEAARPDVVCLQELKCVEAQFPQEWAREQGWHTALACQKTYNGVAILSRTPLTEVRVGLSDGEADEPARLVSAVAGGVRVLSAYVPNGKTVGSDSWHYKLRWLQRLRAQLDARHDPQEPLVLCGDFNVAPEPRDVHDPARWATTVLYHPDARRELQQVRAFGLEDTFRKHHDAEAFSWWDYRAGAFQRNQGLRIDHILATPSLAARCTESSIDREARKGQGASDHAPVLARFAL